MIDKLVLLRKDARSQVIDYISKDDKSWWFAAVRKYYDEQWTKAESQLNINKSKVNMSSDSTITSKDRYYKYDPDNNNIDDKITSSSNVNQVRWIPVKTKVIWQWDFGTIYEWPKGVDAEQLLIKNKWWEVKGAYTYKWQDVDLMRWEYNQKIDTWYWLIKIVKKHPEVLGKIQELLNTLPEKSKTENRIKLYDNKHHITISLNRQWQEKRWILTAFEVD